MAPSIAERIETRTDEELFEIVRGGAPGMPGFRLADDAMRDLAGFLRTLQRGRARAPERDRAETVEGRILEGVVLNRSALDLQLRADDERIHLLRKAGERYREVTSSADWPTYHGDYRRQPLLGARRDRRSERASVWRPEMDLHHSGRSPASRSRRWSSTAFMYVTSVRTSATRSMRATAREALALSSGRARRASSATPSAGINRGVAVAGERLFMVTDHAHLIALDRFTGAAAVGDRDGRLARELRRDVGARSPSATSSSPAPRAATRAFAASSPRSTRRPARRSGASGRCRSAASPAPRPGRARTSIIPARPRG